MNEPNNNQLDQLTSSKMLAMKKTISMSMPLVAARVSSAITTFIAMIMIARLGSQELAASALINSISFSFLVPLWSLFFAVGVLVGHAYGAKEEKNIGKIVRQGLWLGIIVGIPATVILWNVDSILIALGQEKNLAILTQEFFRPYSYGLIPALWFCCVSQFIIAISRQKVALVFTLISVPLMVVSGYILIYGKLGLPALGIKGMGYAHALTFVIEDVIIGLYFYFSKRYKIFNLFARDLKIDFNYLKQLFNLGWPISIMNAGELIVFSLSTILIGWISEQQLAAQQITLQINLIAFMVPFGISTASTILISQEMGRKNVHMIRDLGYSSMALSILATLFFLGIYLLIPIPLINLYLNTENPANFQIAAISIPLLIITGIMNVFDAIRTSALLSLRGMRDTLVPMVIFVVLGCIISLPIGYWLTFPLHYGVIGMRWGFVIGFFVGAIILVHRFHKFSAPEFIADNY